MQLNFKNEQWPPLLICNSLTSQKTSPMEKTGNFFLRYTLALLAVVFCQSTEWTLASSMRSLKLAAVGRRLLCQWLWAGSASLELMHLFYSAQKKKKQHSLSFSKYLLTAQLPQAAMLSGFAAMAASLLVTDSLRFSMMRHFKNAKP